MYTAEYLIIFFVWFYFLFFSMLDPMELISEWRLYKEGFSRIWQQCEGSGVAPSWSPSLLPRRTRSRHPAWIFHCRHRSPARWATRGHFSSLCLQDTERFATRDRSIPKHIARERWRPVPPAWPMQAAATLLRVVRALPQGCQDPKCMQVTQRLLGRASHLCIIHNHIFTVIE